MANEYAEEQSLAQFANPIVCELLYHVGYVQDPTTFSRKFLGESERESERCHSGETRRGNFMLTILCEGSDHIHGAVASTDCA